jgi:Transcription factor IIA, alpha/beta subunit
MDQVESKKFFDGVIKDVIESLRTVFSNEGVQEEVLELLKRSWEANLHEKQRPKLQAVEQAHNYPP